MYGSQEKILGQKVNVTFFTVDPNSVGAGVPRTFLELGKIQKNIFFKIKTPTIKSEKNIYQTIHSTSFIFIFFGIFTIFFVFFPIFLKIESHFWKKKIHFYTLASTAKFYSRISFFGNFPQTLGMLGFMENCETFEKLHLVVCGSDCMIFFLKSGF